MPSNATIKTIDNNIGKIIAVVSTSLNVPTSKMKGIDRTKNVTVARHIAMVLILEQNKISFENLGSIFNRWHRTVVFARDRYNSAIENPKRDPFFSESLNKVITCLN